MAVDPYQFPRLRRQTIRFVAVEIRIAQWLRALRRADPWLVAGFCFGLLTLLSRSWWIGAIFLFLIGLNVVQWLVTDHDLRVANVSETDSLSGAEFERWLARFFEDLGFDVHRTPFARDFGADMIITWRGIRIAVQAKSGHTRVGVSAVQQIVAAKAHYDCEQAMVVTNQYYTDAALVLAESNGVRMRTRDDLARVLSTLPG